MTSFIFINGEDLNSLFSDFRMAK